MGELKASTSTQGGVQTGVWAGGDSGEAKTCLMLRKFRDFKQLMPSLKSATVKLKRLVSLSGLQEASPDENMVLSAEQGAASEHV